MDNNQFVISRELLQILQWMLNNETGALKKIVARGLKNQQNHTCAKQRSESEFNDNLESEEDMQHHIIDFFLMLEALIDETMQEEDANNVIQKSLMPAIDRIDLSTSDDAQVLASSIAKATSTCENKPKEDPKRVLCKELLKRWKPSKSTTYN